MCLMQAFSSGYFSTYRGAQFVIFYMEYVQIQIVHSYCFWHFAFDVMRTELEEILGEFMIYCWTDFVFVINYYGVRVKVSTFLLMVV